MIWPHVRIHRVTELTPERLRALGIDSLLLDVDCTLKRYGRSTPEPDIAEWMVDLRAAGVGLFLVSNGRITRIEPFAKHVDLPFIGLALKPLPMGVRRALRESGFDRKTTAMVGDQVFTDIPAGRLAGVRTVLVDPIHPEEEPFWARHKRLLERIVLCCTRYVDWETDRRRS